MLIYNPYTVNESPSSLRKVRPSSSYFQYGGEGPESSIGDEGGTIVDGGDQSGVINDEEARKRARREKAMGMIGTGINALPSVIGGIAAIVDQQDQNRIQRDMIMQQNRQKPIWDYNAMYGDNQPIIKAAKGALVRTTGSDAAPFKIDNGEFLMLPDGKLERSKGSTKKTDDISTILPEGTKIFSNTLKTIDPDSKSKTKKDTFAKLAMKQDYTEEMKALENPYTTPVSRTSAERMLQRKQKALGSLFEEQQALNGNSSGEVVPPSEGEAAFKKGGMYYEQGGLDQLRPCPPCNTNRRQSMNAFNLDARSLVPIVPPSTPIMGPPTNTAPNPLEYTPVAMNTMNTEPRDFTRRTDKLPLDENGRMMYKHGGVMRYEKGGVYNVSEAEVKRLKKQGYRIEIM